MIKEYGKKMAQNLLTSSLICDKFIESDIGHQASPHGDAGGAEGGAKIMYSVTSIAGDASSSTYGHTLSGEVKTRGNAKTVAKFLESNGLTVTVTINKVVDFSKVRAPKSPKKPAKK